MKLTIADRLSIQAILPKKGTMEQQAIIKDLLTDVQIDGDEAKRIDLKTVYDAQTGTHSVTWNKDKDTGKQVPLEKAEIRLLKKIVDDLDEAKQIDQSNYETCLKIREYKADSCENEADT